MEVTEVRHLSGRDRWSFPLIQLIYEMESDGGEREETHSASD